MLYNYKLQLPNLCGSFAPGERSCVGWSTAASFLQFIQFLIRLSRNVGSETDKSDNRNAAGRPHFHGPPNVIKPDGPTIESRAGCGNLHRAISGASA
jgi:hypothetical protein